MHTIKLQIQDDIYENLKAKGVDVNTQVQEFINDLADDGLAAISTQEAKQRVSAAVERYENNTAEYTPYDEKFVDEMETYIKSL